MERISGLHIFESITFLLKLFFSPLQVSISLCYPCHFFTAKTSYGLNYYASVSQISLFQEFNALSRISFLQTLHIVWEGALCDQVSSALVLVHLGCHKMQHPITTAVSKLALCYLDKTISLVIFPMKGTCKITRFDDHASVDQFIFCFVLDLLPPSY